MSHNGVANTRSMMVVVSMVEEWASLKSLLQDISGEERHHLTFSSQGSQHICDLTVEGQLISLRYSDLKEDMTEEGIRQVIDGVFKSCMGGNSSFLLLISGGYYTKRERRMVEILQANFGADVLKYLVILSVEDGQVADTLDDTLLDLINVCDGRYCRVSSSAAGDGMRALLEMVDYMLSEHGLCGYTEAMMAAAKRQSTEDSAMNMLKQKVKEAEEREKEFKQLVEQREERRIREMEDLKARHTEERRKEAAERQQYEAKREGLEEAMMSHRAVLHIQMAPPHDDETKKMSVVLLGLSGSGKSSALNLILQRAGNQYPVNESINHESAPSTMFCEKKEVFAAGRRLVLVDTPELWDEDGVENVELVKDCLALASPGPHVFLLVLQVGRFTQGESDMLGHLQKIFGREFTEHAVILFVHFNGNKYRPQRINDYVASAHSTLQELIRKCGSRFYELNITKSQNALSYPQVKDLLLGLNKLVASHGGRSYTVRRFSVQELQGRSKMMEERKEEAQEVNYLLRDD